MRGTFAVAIAAVIATVGGCGSQQNSPSDGSGSSSSSGSNGGSNSGSNGSSGGSSGGATSSNGGGNGAGSSGGQTSSGSSGSGGGGSTGGGGNSSSGAGGNSSSGSGSGGGGGADAGQTGSSGASSSSGSGDGGGSGGGPIGDGGENSGANCTVPAIPAFSALTSVASLPDPFTSMSGTRIANKSDWTCRRAEISAELQQFELGAKTPAASTVTGSASGGNITVNVTSGGKSISFMATVTLPTTGKAPYPAMIGIGGISLNTQTLTQQGVALITFNNDDMAAQQSGTSRGMGKFFTLFGSNATAGAMIAWAWGVSRLIDVIEMTPSANIDPKRLGVTGCSRNGKGALVVGAFDERIVLTIPQESGSGGAGSWRVSDAVSVAGTSTQTLNEIVGENVWFSTALNQFAGSGAGHSLAPKLPFDHHELEAMVAPRALLVIENTINWLGPLSTYTASVAANTVWQALGIPDQMGYSENGGAGGHTHCSFPAAQQPDVDAYVQKFLIGGGTASTAIMKQDDNLTYDKATWQPWTVPTLQ